MRRRLLVVAALAAVIGGRAAFAQNPVGSTQQSGTTSGTANTFTTLLAKPAAGLIRRGCLFQNNSSDTEYVFIGSGTATEAASVKLIPGQSFNCANLAGYTAQDTLQIASSGTSSTYTGVSQ